MRKAALLQTLSATAAATFVGGCLTLSTGPGAAAISANTKKQVVMGKSAWQGENDCSATATLAKIAGNLVVTVNVTDDYTSREGCEPYEKDGVELFLDLRRDKQRGKSFYDKGAFQVIVVPPKEDGKAKIYWYQGEGEAPYVAVPGTIATYVKTKNGYQITVSFPLKGLEKKHYPLGDTLNFAFGVNDVDKSGVRTQIVSSGSENNYQDPSGLAPVKL